LEGDKSDAPQALAISLAVEIGYKTALPKVGKCFMPLLQWKKH